MNIYKVSGKVIYTETCSCEFCEGHENKGGKQEVEVEALDEEMAVKFAVDLIKRKNLFRWADSVFWDENEAKPTVEYLREVTEEILMLRMGYKPLWSLLQTVQGAA